MNLFFQKIKNFLNSDIRWKLIKISKLVKIKIYPEKIHNKGIKSLYSKFIFNLIFFEKSKIVKKNIYNKIFSKKILENSFRNNLLVSTPRSGGTFTRMMLTSYIELFYKVGNGIPKYDSINNKWMFSIEPVLNGDLYNSINLERLILKSNPFKSEEEFHRKKIIFSRTPISPLEICELNNSKVVIIFRNPYEQIISYYTNHIKSESSEKLNEILFKKSLSNYLNYFNFWREFIKNKKVDEDYVIVKHEELNNNSEKILKKILKFYEYEIDDKLVIQAVSINTKKNTLKYIENIKIRKIRFTDEKKKKIFRDLITNKINEIYKKELIDSYQNL
jgi:hypothetical protein